MVLEIARALKNVSVEQRQLNSRIPPLWIAHLTIHFVRARHPSPHRLHLAADAWLSVAQ